MADENVCNRFVSWWGGEYEGNCELFEGHEGPHWDGLSWYDDDGEEVPPGKGTSYYTEGDTEEKPPAEAECSECVSWRNGEYELRVYRAGYTFQATIPAGTQADAVETLDAMLKVDALIAAADAQTPEAMAVIWWRNELAESTRALRAAEARHITALTQLQAATTAQEEKDGQ